MKTQTVVYQLLVTQRPGKIKMQDASIMGTFKLLDGFKPGCSFPCIGMKDMRHAFLFCVGQKEKTPHHNAVVLLSKVTRPYSDHLN